MGRLAIFFLIFAASALGQMDSSSLRVRFGAPLNREVFTVRPGIEMIVDYSPTSNHVCRLELPGDTKKLTDELLAEIVPLSMRGEEGASFCTTSGINWMCSTDYEHVSVVESSNGGQRTVVIVRFKMAGCSTER